MASSSSFKKPETGRRAPVEAVTGVDRYWAKVRSGHAVGHDYATLLGLRTYDTVKLRQQVAKGLSFHAWERFVKATALPANAAARVVQIKPRTLSRRKQEGRFHPDESDRLLRVARVFARALVLFEGDLAATRSWLGSSQPGLGGATPLEYASTEVGSREVEELIGRLEFGIPS